MKSRVLISGVMFAVASVAHAEPLAEKSNLHEAVANKTVVLHTPAGGLPISYSDNGTMIGRAKDMVFYTGSAFDRGTWWVIADRICHRWRSWLGGKDHCVTVKMDGDKVLWKSSDGYSGTATIASKK